MNGSRILEGFIPDVDATVVSRILDAGGHIVGKAVCEDLGGDGGSFTSVTGPVVNPHNKERMAGGSSSGSAVLVRGINDSLPFLVSFPGNGSHFFISLTVVVSCFVINQLSLLITV